jgi:hypothetical protein
MVFPFITIEAWLNPLWNYSHNYPKKNALLRSRVWMRTHSYGTGAYGEDQNNKHPKVIGLSGCTLVVVVLVRPVLLLSGLENKPNTQPQDKDDSH